MPNEIILTREGYEKLKEELEFLKGPERTRIAEAIREAKSHGDLRENAAYHEAKMNQGRLEGRIHDIQKALEIAKVVDVADDAAEHIQLGSSVVLKSLDNGAESTVELVGAFEADPSQGKVSIASPLGSALLERKVGDEIEVQAPKGLKRYAILSFQ